MTEREFSRRRVLATTGSALATAAAGCVSSPDECSPAEFPKGTETRDKPPEPCQFGAELESQGMDVDSTMPMSGGVSLMYYRDPDRHREQIHTVALAFVQYRRIVDPDDVLSFTALESANERHGTAYISREWADSRANGNMSESRYLEKVRDTYRTQ